MSTYRPTHIAPLDSFRISSYHQTADPLHSTATYSNFKFTCTTLTSRLRLAANSCVLLSSICQRVWHCHPTHSLVLLSVVVTADSSWSKQMAKYLQIGWRTLADISPWVYGGFSTYGHKNLVNWISDWQGLSLRMSDEFIINYVELSSLLSLSQ